MLHSDDFILEFINDNDHYIHIWQRVKSVESNLSAFPVVDNLDLPTETVPIYNVNEVYLAHFQQGQVHVKLLFKGATTDQVRTLASSLFEAATIGTLEYV